MNGSRVRLRISRNAQKMRLNHNAARKATEKPVANSGKLFKDSRIQAHDFTPKMDYSMDGYCYNP